LDNVKRFQAVIVAILKLLFEEPAALLVRFWKTIPDYLPFYLFVVLGIYTLWGSRRHTTIIAPFNLPPGDLMPFSGRTVANSLRDAFTRIHSEVNIGLAEYSKRGLELVIEKKLQERSRFRESSRTTEIPVTATPSTSGPTVSGDLSQDKWRNINFATPTFTRFSLPTSFEVPTQFQAQVQGFSHEALLSLGRRVRGNERLISGDILSAQDKNEFYLVARAKDGGPWKLGPFKHHVDGLQVACERLALEILKTLDPPFYAAHQTFHGKFEVAFRSLLGILTND
jgi:hypothetical protein